MARIPWREGTVLSIETRPGLFVLAQMLKEPSLGFFNLFRNVNEWDDVVPSDLPKLFDCFVTRQFINASNCKKWKLKPCCWEPRERKIDTSNEFSRVVVWEGTPQERSIGLIGARGKKRLVEPHPVDRFAQNVVLPAISENDADTINGHELKNLGINPEMNERLYLCHIFGRNVDPLKDVLFQRPIPAEYETYLDIIGAEKAK